MYLVFYAIVSVESHCEVIETKLEFNRQWTRSLLGSLAVMLAATYSECFEGTNSILKFHLMPRCR